MKEIQGWTVEGFFNLYLTKSSGSESDPTEQAVGSATTCTETVVGTMAPMCQIEAVASGFPSDLVELLCASSSLAAEVTESAMRACWTHLGHQI